QLVAEHVEPAADDLPVDALRAHPLQALLGVAQPGSDRAREGAAGEAEAHAALVALDLHRGELALTLGQGLEQRGGHEMSVDVDDHGVASSAPGSCASTRRISARNCSCSSA